MTQKWALITGAAKRIGRAITLELAAAGWDIVIHYNTSGAEAEALAGEIGKMGRAACLAKIDLANEALARKLINSVTQGIGPLAALINNASLFDPDDQDPEGIRHHAINVQAPRLLSEGFYSRLPADGLGNIINLLDVSPVLPRFSTYYESKQSLQRMTLEMAKQYAPRVRVNGVAPGMVLPHPRQSDAHFQKMAAEAPLRHAAEPVEIAKAVRFLLESPSITGAVIPVDGGRHLLAPPKLAPVRSAPVT